MHYCRRDSHATSPTAIYANITQTGRIWVYCSWFWVVLVGFVGFEGGFGWFWVVLGRFGWFWVVLGGFGWFRVLVTTTEVCKFLRNISTNIYGLGKRTDLKLGEVPSLFISNKITISWLYPLNGFRLIFFIAWQWKRSIEFKFERHHEVDIGHHRLSWPDEVPTWPPSGGWQSVRSHGGGVLRQIAQKGSKNEKNYDCVTEGKL